VAFSHYNNISAQLPIDSQSGEVVAVGIKEQALQCMENVKAIVESVGHTIDDVVKINVQLKDISDADEVGETLSRFFSGDLPAKTIIGVSVIPQGALIQLDAIVSNCEGTPPKF
jgi:enamine deaminase RidA (YjgF/YER057c/UK114 family)